MDRVPTTHMTTTTSKPTIHSITLPCGKVETRKSPRIYTHAVVVTLGDRHLAQQIKNEEADIDYVLNLVAKYTKVIETGIIPLNGNGEKSSCTLEDYKKWISEYQVRISKSQQRIEKHRAMIGTGWKDYFVAGWSQSAVNAAKMANGKGFFHADKIQVVEVTRG